MTKTELTDLTLVEARQGLLDKKFSAVELTASFIEQMEKNRHLNAYITETPDIALTQAKESDERLKKGTAGLFRGPSPCHKRSFLYKRYFDHCRLPYAWKLYSRI